MKIFQKILNSNFFGYMIICFTRHKMINKWFNIKVVKSRLLKRADNIFEIVWNYDMGTSKNGIATLTWNTEVFGMSFFFFKKNVADVLIFSLHWIFAKWLLECLISDRTWSKILVKCIDFIRFTLILLHVTETFFILKNISQFFCSIKLSKFREPICYVNWYS